MRGIIYLSIFGVFSCFLVSVQAAPEAFELRKIYSEDGVYSLTGNGFGEKQRGAPIIWENFEDGSDGEPLPSTGKWKPHSDDGGYFSDVSNSYLSLPDTSYSGKLAAHNRFKVGSSGVNASFNSSYLQFAPEDQVYYSYRWRVEATTEGSGRMIGKLGRINSNFFTPINPYNGRGSVAYSTFNPISAPHLITASLGTGDDVFTSTINQDLLPEGFKTVHELGRWHRHEMFVQLSTPGEANGSLWFGADNYTVYRELDAITRSSGDTYQYVTVLLGLLVAGMERGSETEVCMWVDDVYVDNTQARVELCNGADRTSPLICELQIPTSWDQGRIDFQFNKGRLKDGERLFFFIFDDKNRVSKSFGPFRLAGSDLILDDGSTPPVPTGLMVVD